MQNYYSDAINDADDDADDGKSFKYKTKIIGTIKVRRAQGRNDECTDQPPRDPLLPLNTEVTISLKYFGNFWRCLELSLINCEVELDLLWAKDFVLFEDDENLVNATFEINSTKLYVPLVTLSMNNNNLGYMIDPTFRNFSRLFVQSLKVGENDPTRNYFTSFNF